VEGEKAERRALLLLPAPLDRLVDVEHRGVEEYFLPLLSGSSSTPSNAVAKASHGPRMSALGHRRNIKRDDELVPGMLCDFSRSVERSHGSSMPIRVCDRRFDGDNGTIKERRQHLSLL
jgi:hypothetical protein